MKCPAILARLVCLPVLVHAACNNASAPIAPSLAVPNPVFLEGEAGNGDGEVRQRSRASGGRIVHLGPGEQRHWLFVVASSQPLRYELSLTYSNGKGGENEVISVSLDGTAIYAFRNRDIDDGPEPWEVFATDPAGISELGSGSHTLTISVSGGDGCVEVDRVTLTPAS